MTEKNRNIIAFEGGKKGKISSEDDSAILIVEGEQIDLDSFVLSGQNKDGSRVMLTWGCSLDSLTSYTKVLEVVVNEKIKEALNE